MSNSAIKNMSMLVSSQVVAIVANLLIQIVLARLLLPEGRGVYAICIMFAALMSVLTYLGNEFGIRHLLVRNKLTTQQAFGYLLTTCLGAFLASLLVVYLSTFFEFGFLGKTNDSQLLLSIIFGASQLISVQVNVFLSISGRFKDAAIFAVFSELTKLLIIVVALNHTDNVETALLATIVANFFVILIYIVKYNLIGVNTFRIELSVLRYIYSYGLKSFVFNFTNFANIHIGVMILSFFLSNEKIGIYSFAYALVSKVQVLPDAINRYLVPAVSAKKSSLERKQMILVTMLGLLILCISVMIFLIFFGELLVLWLFGESYVQATLLIKLLFLGFIFKMLAKPIEAYFSEISGQPLDLTKVNLITLCFMIVSMLAFTPNFGVLGAVFTNVCAMLFGFLLLYSMFTRAFSTAEKRELSFLKVFKKTSQFILKKKH